MYEELKMFEKFTQEEIESMKTPGPFIFPHIPGNTVIVSRPTGPAKEVKITAIDNLSGKEKTFTVVPEPEPTG